MAEFRWLSEAQMRRIEPYFPLSHGIPRVDDRRVISGIIFVIRNGLRWRDVPAEYGPPKTIYNRFIRWSRLGVFNRIFAFGRHLRIQFEGLEMQLDLQGITDARDGGLQRLQANRAPWAGDVRDEIDLDGLRHGVLSVAEAMRHRYRSDGDACPTVNRS